MSAFESACQRFRSVHRLQHALTFLSWDQAVMMPPGGLNARADAMAELSASVHARLTAPELNEDLQAAADLDLNLDERVQLREMRRAYRQASCLPSDLVEAQVRAGARCEHAWREQRRHDDWPGFLQNFRTVVDLSRQEAQHRQQAEADRLATPYDAMLDVHCRGDNSALINQLFEQLKPQLQALLPQVMERQAQRNPTNEQDKAPFDIDAQRALNFNLMRSLGFDFDAGRLDVSTHPFSTGVRGDHRITTRFSQDSFFDAMQGTAHEVGHASYEAGLPEALAGLPAGLARNMSVHESQSVLFERHVFMSQPFLRHLLPHVHEAFPAARSWTAEDLWSHATRVQPGYIRVEADEVCYPLHVMLRYEIERDLINGAIEADDIPDLWETQVQTLLNLSVGHQHSRGCMQDIHWTDGAFGYFPSYALGAINAAQIMHGIRTSHEDWEQRLADGDVGFIRTHLLDRIWQHGSML